MITGFILHNGRLQQIKIEEQKDIIKEMIWIDLIDPTEEERLLVENHYKFELPEKAEIKDIEASARFYEDDDGIHIHSFFLNDFEDSATNVTVAFSIFAGCLFTIRDEDLSSFRLYRLRARHPTVNDMDNVVNAMDILVGLHETAVEHVADALEGIYSRLEHVSRDVLDYTKQSSGGDSSSSSELKKLKKEIKQEMKEAEQESKAKMGEILVCIAREEDINGKARLSLMDTRRSLSFLVRGRLLNDAQNEDVREILRDLESLTGHTSFLFDKINFLLEAAMGQISLEQSRIIKIFSIASVVFLPPTLIASIYGMNFSVMPELNFPYSYPLSIAGMFLSGIAPYLLFKKKGWL